MKLESWLLSGALAGSLVLSGWLFLDNRSLRAELDAERGDTAVTQKAAPDHSLDDPVDPDPEPAPVLPRDARDAPPAFGRDGTVRNRPEPPEEAPEESRQERRVRRQAEITAMFGRLDGETPEEYRERMVPFVEMALSLPRNRLQDARRAAEEAAGVSDAQRAELDAAFQDAYSEALALTNRAVESGDLTPYERNWSGVLNVAGGLGAVLEGTESRIGEILTPEQMGIIYGEGFEWGEYLGVSVPWEDLQPPPPPPPGS